MPLSDSVPTRLFEWIANFSSALITRMPLSGSVPVILLRWIRKFLSALIVWMPVSVRTPQDDSDVCKVAPISVFGLWSGFQALTVNVSFDGLGKWSR
eukprot:3236725-Amphidinium_carterae.1